MRITQIRDLVLRQSSTGEVDISVTVYIDPPRTPIDIPDLLRQIADDLGKEKEERLTTNQPN